MKQATFKSNTKSLPYLPSTATEIRWEFVTRRTVINDDTDAIIDDTSELHPGKSSILYRQFSDEPVNVRTTWHYSHVPIVIRSSGLTTADVLDDHPGSQDAELVDDRTPDIIDDEDEGPP